MGKGDPRAFCERSGTDLEDSQVDGVVVTAPTTMHKEIILAAANAGKHVLWKKVWH